MHIGHPVTGVSVVNLRRVKTMVGVVTDAATGQIIGMDVLVNRDTEGFVYWTCAAISHLLQY